MTSQIIICMAIFVVTLISYMLNKIPMWVTAMLSMAALYITGCIDDTGALSGFANNNTILMATMFMVAAGFRRTSLVETMCNGLLRLTKGSFQKAYVGYLLLGALLTNFISSSCSRIFSWQTRKAYFSFSRFFSTTARSAGVARRSTGRRGETSWASSREKFPRTQWAYSRPEAVSTMTLSPGRQVRPWGSK